MSRGRSSIQLSLEQKIARDGDWSAVEFAETESLRVHIDVEGGTESAVAREIESQGGTVHHSFDGVIIAETTAGSITDLADISDVSLIREPPEQIPHRMTPEGVEVQDDYEPTGEGLLQSEGREIHRALNLHQEGITGEDTLVAVFDTGFDVNNPKYADKIVATLGAEPGDDVWETAYESPGGHGDAVTDIIASMAPDAEFVLADTFDAIDLFDALELVDDEYSDVVVGNYSVGHSHNMRIDGEDEISQAIDEYFTKDGERIFVNSAGNSARVDTAWMWDDDEGEPVPLPQGSDGDLWHGPFTDDNDNGLMEFDENLPDPERLPVATTDDFAGLPGPIGTLNVHWDADIDEDDQVYVARVYDELDAEDPIVESRTDNPWESFDVMGDWFEDGDDRVWLEIENEDADGEQYFDVWAQFDPVLIPPIVVDGDLYPLAANDRTIGIPSVSQDEDLLSAAAVQAVDVGPGEGQTEVAFDLNKGDLKGYSSQGPTQDDRQGIDQAGMAHVSTEAFGPIEEVFGMNGTSAASPHVAGAVALLFAAMDAAGEEHDTEAIRDGLAATGTGIADPQVGDPPNTMIGNGLADVHAAAIEMGVVDVDPISLSHQAIMPGVDWELSVTVGEGEADNHVIVTTAPGPDPDPEDYEGEEIVGAVQLDEDLYDQEILVDVEGADPDDHAAHYATDLVDDVGETVSADQLEEIEATSEPAGIYATMEFDWTNDVSTSPVQTVTVEEIRIDYEGEAAPEYISIDLHELDAGEPGAFIGISQEDLAVNETHLGVDIDVVEPVTPEEVEAGEAERSEDYITRTDDYFAMAHIGPAAEDRDGGRIPAGQPPLLQHFEADDEIETLPIGDSGIVFVEDISLQVQNSIDIPNKTVVTHQDEDERFGSNEFTVTGIKRAREGDSITVSVEAPDDFSYDVEIHDSDLDMQDYASGSGNEIVDFDLDEYEPGAYLIAAVTQGQALTVFPVVVEAYATTIEAAPSKISTGDTAEVVADVSSVVADPPEIDDVVLAGLSDSDDTGISVTMEEDGEYYVAEIIDPPADDYQLHVTTRGGEEIEFDMDTLTIEEETTEGDRTSLEDAEPQFIDDLGGRQPLGLSDAHDLTVELDDGDKLVEDWMVDLNALDPDTQPNLQYSRLGVDGDNVVVGGLDEYVTVHARNSGEQWLTPVERAGDLSDSSPILVDGVAYVGDGGGAFHAIDVADGLYWTVDDLGSAVTSTPVYAETGELYGTDLICFGQNDGTVHAVSEFGDVEWSTELGAGVYSELDVGWFDIEDFEVPLLAVTTAGGHLVVIDLTGWFDDLDAGDVLLEAGPEVTGTENFGNSSPVFKDEMLYVAADDYVHAIDVMETLATGEPELAWQAENDGNAGASPALSADGNRVYVADAEGTITAYKTGSGDEVDSVEVSDEPVASTPTVVNGRVVVGAKEGAIAVISESDMDVVDAVTVPGAVLAEPVVRDDTIYVGTAEGIVAAIENLP